MSRQKTKFAFFTVPEYEKEGKWLREHHKNGWRLISATLPGCYHFEECEPEDVVYQLDYNKDGMANRTEYIQMFQDCGWEHVTDMAGFSYFRKPVSEMKEEEEIFNDDESKMDMIRRVYSGRMVPLLVIFFCLLLPQFIRQMNYEETGLTIFMGILLGVYVVVFIQFVRQYWKLKKK